MPKRLELTAGQTFGRLTVVRRVENTETKPTRTRWLCDCRCGRQLVTLGTFLNTGKAKSCGCGFHINREIAFARKFVNLEGKKFGRLTVIEMAFRRSGGIYWRCRCACGNQMLVLTCSLKSGASRSCGCLHSSRMRRHARTAPRDQFGRFTNNQETDNEKS